ncbi:hypothetical protein WDW86_05040 [Bdellovibrionota bacterium FG-2]
MEKSNYERKSNLKPTQQEGERKFGKREPIREFKAQLSEDGRYWIFRDVTTWLIPVNYLLAITKSKADRELEPVDGESETDRDGDDRTS